MKKFLLALILFTAFGFTEANAKVTAVESDDDSEIQTTNSDPLEPINRAIFKFNNVVDIAILKPVSKTYRSVVPAWGRERVSNILFNLTEPLTVVNSTLQGDDINAFTSLWRFIFNTSFGLLGTFDVATELGLKARREDLGQTLAVWGWTDSSYLVLPILGPSTLRDGIGIGVEYYADPIDNSLFKVGQANFHRAVAGVDRRTTLLPTTDQIDKTSLDKYTSYKSIYLQNRNNAIANGK